jgi:uncharacterized protein (TIGR02117 family)
LQRPPRKGSRQGAKALCLKIVRYGLVAFVSLLAALLLGYLLPTKWHYIADSDCTYPIYISNVNQFHAELIVPVTTADFDWRSHLNLAQLGPKASRYRYLSFGWGDRQFFMNGSFDLVSIFDALFLPGPSTMHVWGHIDEPSQLSAQFEVKQVWLSRTEYLKLIQFVSAGFRRTNQGAVQYIRPGLYPDSGFYEAVGSYSILQTCNTWTAKALQQADVNTPTWSALAPSVMYHLRSNCGLAR